MRDFEIKNRKKFQTGFYFLLVILLFIVCGAFKPEDPLKQSFLNPPESSKPGVYWYFMDGNLSRDEMTKDLESMKEAGINHVIFLEVGIGVPRGPVDFMSGQWQELFVHAVREAERLGIKILLGAGPGWCGSGGPWVKPEESMKHLVYSETEVEGGKKIDIELPVPEQRSTQWHKMKNPYYEDVAVYAIPCSAVPLIADINEKALYVRDPYSSKPNVKPFLPSLARYDEPESSKIVAPSEIINLSENLHEGGRLRWDAPEGKWTIIRMGKRVTGASSRPAPEPAIGLESNKMDTLAFRNHLKNYTDILLEKAAPRKEGVGWTGFHIDSWESGAQNWTEGLIGEFKKRRGYDPESFLLTYTGRAVRSVELTERFLWDLRQTCKELVLENHVEYAKKYAHRNGLELTIEPYDMNPAGDLDLGAIADVIMAEFWSNGFGFNTIYAVLQATSIAHIKGHPVVGAEAFTSQPTEAWSLFPGNMKNQSDWALAHGINRFVFHTFAHKPLGDEYRPGMTMGRYGVHWDRGQTWWPLVKGYHDYISRCSHMMQQGQSVADILYLTPEGAPMVFTPPADALEGDGMIPYKRGYGFDGCSPKMLMDWATVENGKIVFPGASSYEILVLPNFETMTPELLKQIKSLVEQGAKIIGIPPAKSPSLVNYPNCDNEVRNLSEKLWGTLEVIEDEEKPLTPTNLNKGEGLESNKESRDVIVDTSPKSPFGGYRGSETKLNNRKFGAGSVFWGANLSSQELYPDYKSTAELLSRLNITEDFSSDNTSIRFGHRRTVDKDIYFVANRTGDFQKTVCTFRAIGEPELWNSINGETRKLTNYTIENGRTKIPMEFFPYESFFVVFTRKETASAANQNVSNFPVFREVKTLDGAWNVSFNPKFGGPENIVFNELQDWTKHEMRGIKYYSGIATYKKTFNIKDLEGSNYFIELGVVNDMARVKLNGKDLGVVWCAPWRMDISEALKEGKNELEIEVANRWVNRLLGDRQEPDANVRTVKFENGLMGGQEFRTGRYTFTTKLSMSAFKYTEPLSSGLLGPVRIMQKQDIN